MYVTKDGFKIYVTEDGFEITEEQFLQFANINGYDLIDRLKKEKERLEQEKLNQLYASSGMSEDDFYKSEMLKYSEEISKLIIKDYDKILDDDTKEKIKNFQKKESIVFQDKKDFPKVSVDGKKPGAYARKSVGKVYFPLYDKSEYKEDIITFIRQREQELVHEMFHIVTKNHSEKEDLVQNGIKVGEYKPGSLFEEALVEKSARDFATKHNLVYQPMAQYIPYVNSLETFMSKYNIQHNHQMFNRNHQQIIGIATQEEQQQYYAFEYNHNLRRLGKKNINNESYAPVQNVSNLGQQNQLSKPKTRVRTIGNTITPNNSGFANGVILVIVGIVIVLGIAFGFLLD